MLRFRVSRGSVVGGVRTFSSDAQIFVARRARVCSLAAARRARLVFVSCAHRLHTVDTNEPRKEVTQKKANEYASRKQQLEARMRESAFCGLGSLQRTPAHVATQSFRGARQFQRRCIDECHGGQRRHAVWHERLGGRVWQRQQLCARSSLSARGPLS